MTAAAPSNADLGRGFWAGANDSWGDRIVFSVGLAIALTVVLVFPFADMQLPALPKVGGLHAALLLAADLVVLRALAGSPLTTATALLAAGFSFTAVMALSWILLFPGAVAGTGSILRADPGSFGWLFAAWKLLASLLVALAVFAWPGRALRGSMGPACAAGVALALAMHVLVTHGGLLPPYFVDPQMLRFSPWPLRCTYAAATVSALALLYAWLADLMHKRLVWLPLLLAADAAGLVLSTFSGGRFTLGWYASRALSGLAAAGIIFVVLVLLRRGRAGRGTH